MEKDHVTLILDGFEQVSPASFTIKQLDATASNFLPGFQKGKEAVAGFEVTKQEDNSSYLFAFIRSGESYQLVIYSSTKKALAELKNIEMQEGTPSIIWKYSPAKRDGKNQDRKDYFSKNFGHLIRHIPIPKSPSDTEAFIGELFTLCQHRFEADNLGEE